MASTLMHLAVAKRVNEQLQVNENAFFLGTIAPDIAKLVGSARKISHFVTKVNSDSPDLDYFLNKYKKYLNNPYELGYYVHLLTDKLWIDEFLPNFINDVYITSKTGEKLKFEPDEISDLLYNDYTNMNEQLLDYYALDFSLFYEKFPYPKTYIEEIDPNNFDEVIKKLSQICTMSSNHNYIINFPSIVHFIEYVSIYVLDEIKKLDL